MASGEILEILGTDPGSKKDIPDFGNKGGNQFVGMVEASEGNITYFIKKE